MKGVGASLLEQKFASRTHLKATIHQTEQVITVATRGRGFALDETLYPDGRSHPSNLQLLGANCLTARTAWSKDQKAARRDLSDQNQTGKRGPTDRQKVPDKRGENRGRCFHPKAQRRTGPNLCPPNLAQTSLSLVTGVVASQKSSTDHAVLPGISEGKWISDQV
jgi:hypothetical protein